MGFVRSALGAIVLFLSVCVPIATPQTPSVSVTQAPAPHPPSPYFSGFVTELKPDSILVSRKTSNGKTTIQKVFVMDAQTKVEGKLKVSSRVTVRFEALGDIHRAVHIIVR